MKITSETPFTANGAKCDMVVLMTETGESLWDAVWADTDTGEYETYVRGSDGNYLVDSFGAKITKREYALQFFFTLTAGPRKELQETSQPQVGPKIIIP